MKQLFSKYIVFSLMAVSVISCKKNDTGAGAGSPGTPLTNDINLSNSGTLGQYLTTKQGLALYTLADDIDGQSTCTGDCALIWPPFTADLATATFDNGLKASDFATITTAGKQQVTYKGWPLHTYSPAGSDGYGTTTNIPEPSGTTQGDGILGVWFVAKPDYTIMLAEKQLTGLDGNHYKSDYTVGNGTTLYFTNSTGNTLYTYALDSFNLNKFTLADLSNNATFPIYEQPQVVVPSILNKAFFGNITVSGKQQLTYRGWPLHFFGQDSTRGSTKAVSVTAPGTWRAAAKDIDEAKK